MVQKRPFAPLFTYARDRIFYGVTSVINLRAILEEHSKSDSQAFSARSPKISIYGRNNPYRFLTNQNTLAPEIFVLRRSQVTFGFIILHLSPLKLAANVVAMTRNWKKKKELECDKPIG